MKISRNTFCELVVVLAVAGCGGGNNNGNAMPGNGALGMSPTIAAQVQGWNGLTGPVSAMFANPNAAEANQPPEIAVGPPGNVDTSGNFSIMLPANPPQVLPDPMTGLIPPCGDYSAGYSVVKDFMFPAASPAPVDVIVPGHVRYIHFVWVPVEETAISSDPSVKCSIDFKPGWNIWVDEIDMTPTATVPRCEWTGPLPKGTQWVLQ